MSGQREVLLPERRYRDDAEYRSVADLLESLLHGAKLTPYELREIATLAAIHYELRRAPERVRVVLGELQFDDERSARLGSTEPPPAVLVDGVLYKREV